MTRLALCLLLLTLAGCRGPKGSPEGTVESFYSAVGAEDWDSLADTISKESMKRLGSRQKAMAVFARDFSGWKDIELTIDSSTTDADEKGATVRFTCQAAQIQNHKRMEFDCSDAVGLVKEEDGKWHMHLPGGGSLRPM